MARQCFRRAGFFGGFAGSSGTISAAGIWPVMGWGMGRDSGLGYSFARMVVQHGLYFFGEAFHASYVDDGFFAAGDRDAAIGVLRC